MSKCFPLRPETRLDTGMLSSVALRWVCKCLNQGSPPFLKNQGSPFTNGFETENHFLAQIHAKGCQFATHTFEIKTWLICLQSLTKIKDIHQCKDTDHVYAVVRTRPWATHVVRAGDLAPAGTMLVTPGLNKTHQDGELCGGFTTHQLLHVIRVRQQKAMLNYAGKFKRKVPVIATTYWVWHRF